MAEIKAFRGLRFAPKAGTIDSLCCPPYDIISEEERQAFLAANPYNIIRLELPKEGDDPYAKAAEVYQSWRKDAALAQDENESLYIYEEQFTVGGVAKSFKGFFCAVKLEEFAKGIVLPHEETLSKAKEDRLNLMKACGCNFSPIYSLYFDKEKTVEAVLEQESRRNPDVDFVAADGVRQRLWAVTDAASIQTIVGAFGDKKLYIADGHHRDETALNYRNFLRASGVNAPEADYVMMALVEMEHPGLVIFPTHRVVRSLEQFDPAAVLAGCRPYFNIEEIAPNPDAMEALLKEKYATGQKSFVFIHGSNACLMTLKDPAEMERILPGCSPAYQQLDVNILHKLVLERILGIDKANMANQKNLYYTRDLAEAAKAAASPQANCAFLLNPTRVEELAEVAAAGEKMPQKSTYFYPKLITGLVMARLQ